MSKYQSNIPNKTTRIAVSQVESTGTIGTKLLIKMNLILKLNCFWVFFIMKLNRDSKQETGEDDFLR